MTSADFCYYLTGCPEDYIYIGANCCELPLTPILLNINGNSFLLALTDAEHGVDFDFFGDGKKRRIAWTTANTHFAWLALDRDGDGKITSGRELFGNATPQPPSRTPNGFSALAEFDTLQKGGNGDGMIDGRDAIFASLRLWVDADHDGISQPAELSTLPSRGVESISLTYRVTFMRDRYGNRFRYRTLVSDVPGAAIGRFAYDVFLTMMPGEQSLQQSERVVQRLPGSNRALSGILSQGHR